MTDPTTHFAASGDPVEILNWRRVSSLLTTSGQPTETQLPRLKTLGVTRVINLGLHSHPMALPDEAASLAALGIAYDHIPVDFAAPGKVDFQRYRAALDQAAGETVHVHCIYNARVSAFVYRSLADGPSADRAAALLDSIWRPGGVWAQFIGRPAEADHADRYAGRDY